MQNGKLIITPKRYKDETQVVSVRMPKDMLHDIDAVAQNTGRARNEIILMAIEFTLGNMEIAEEA